MLRVVLFERTHALAVSVRSFRVQSLGLAATAANSNSNSLNQQSLLYSAPPSEEEM